MVSFNAPIHEVYNACKRMRLKIENIVLYLNSIQSKLLKIYFLYQLFVILAVMYDKSFIIKN